MQSILSNFYERMGLNHFVSGEYDKAERWFRKLEAREPNSIRVLRNLGVILLSKGDPEGAERYLVREEKLYGKSFYRHAALADLAYGRGRRKEAERRYAAALEEPEAAEGGKAAGTRRIMELRLAICREEASFAKTREAMKRFESGQELMKAGKHEEAIAAFMDSIELDPTNWPALNNAGSIYLNALGDLAQARALFERAFGLSRNIQVARNLELTMRLQAQGGSKGRKR